MTPLSFTFEKKSHAVVRIFTYAKLIFELLAVLN